MKISADFLDFNSIVETSVVKIAEGVTLTITPVKKDVIVNGETVVENKLEFKFEDTNLTYTLTYEYDKKELKQFITLLQQMQSQIQAESNKTTASSGAGTCSR